MDIKVNNTEGKGQYLEYNTLGGVFDFYFVAGPTPLHVSSQYAGIVGLPVMMPYWGFGVRESMNLADLANRKLSSTNVVMGIEMSIR